MAHPRARAIGVGAFMIAALLLFAIGLFMIGNRRMLFSKSFVVQAQFARLAGLQNGAKVRVSGMDAGEVTEIHVPPGPEARFVVLLRVRQDLQPLVRADSVATIQSDGLVGNKFVQIDAGSQESPVVADHGVVQSAEPFDMTDLLQRMSDTVDAIDATISNVQDEVQDTLSAISDTAQSTQELVDQVGGDVKAIAESGHKLTDNVTAITSDLRNGKGTVGRLLTDDTIYRQVRDIATQAQAAVGNLRDASEQAKSAIASFRGEKSPVNGLTGSMTQTLTAAREAMEDLAENAEALKHNFLFRGFFNKRGYFDLGDVSVQQYRSGLLESAGRVPLRIWLNAQVLFAPGPAGSEQLTDQGRARLDSAMSQFVRYPRNSPLVVEGYAPDLTADTRFLASRRRAELVRGYLIDRFQLDARTVATMSMGASASNSPAGDAWDGVALALFVEKEAFQEPPAVAQGLIQRK